MRFVYSLVRFVPEPSRGEFINVGAIVGSDISSEWQIRQIENPVRARSLDDRSLLDAVWSFMDRVGSQIDQYEESLEALFSSVEEINENWLDQLHGDLQNIVQLSVPTPLSATSADEAMDRVFDLMILDPASRHFQFRKKHAALAALRNAYGSRGISKGRDLRERVQLRTEHHSGTFDFAVTNGKVLQLTQAFSFQVPDQSWLADQIKAWGWTVRDAQESGGSVLAGNREFDVESDVDIEVVYVPPRKGDESPALRDAQHVFEALHVEARSLTEATLVAMRAEQLLEEAGVGRLPTAALDRIAGELRKRNEGPKELGPGNSES